MVGETSNIFLVTLLQELLEDEKEQNARIRAALSSSKTSLQAAEKLLMSGEECQSASPQSKAPKRLNVASETLNCAPDPRTLMRATIKDPDFQNLGSKATDVVMLRVRTLYKLLAKVCIPARFVHNARMPLLFCLWPSIFFFVCMQRQAEKLDPMILAADLDRMEEVSEGAKEVVC
jgi:hypothetical protein